MFKFFTCLCVVVLWAGSSTVDASAQASLAGGQLDQDRKQYSEAIQAIRKGRFDDAKQLSKSLAHYPLALYLEYYRLTAQISKVSDVTAKDFMARAKGTPLAARFQTVYLKQLGKRRHWNRFLSLQSSVPHSISLQCYFYRAKLAKGERSLAWAGARKLWVYGKSRPDACDALFSRWQKAGKRTDELVWQRSVLAFDARQTALLKYLATLGSPALKARTKLLSEVYSKPEKLLTTQWSSNSVYAKDIVAHGLKRLASLQPKKALASYAPLAAKMGLSVNENNAIMAALASRIISRELHGMTPWLDNIALPALGDNKLTTRRLRWQLSEQDWRGFEQVLAHLTPSEANKSRWRYWRAMIADRQGDKPAAKKVFTELAKERGYYAFLSAEALGQPYELNDKPPIVEAGVDLKVLQPALLRVAELLHHNDSSFALMEWQRLLANGDKSTQKALAQEALDKGWYRMSIAAANRAGEHNWLAARFPQPFTKTFQHHAQQWNVPLTELMSIARRESAFLPQARSRVGARGLMQLMPATGKQVARKLGRRYSTSKLYQVDENITLGSAYYKELLDRYQGNRVLALAAYNAGMHRVDRWHKKDQATLPVNLWVDTIPFKETRAYVQAVLAYNVVFSHLQGKNVSLFTQGETKAVY